MSGNEQTLAERRKVTHQLVSRLFETENIGQAIHFGRWEAYRKYVQSMSDVQQTISALDTLFTDSLQKARLDTLSSLLADKQENMKRLVLALEHNSAPQIYQPRHRYPKAAYHPANHTERQIIHGERTEKEFLPTTGFRFP